MESKEQLPVKILCPFCNAPYTAQMLLNMESAGYFYESDQGLEEPTGSVEITCTNCRKVVYKKEYV